MSRPNLILVQGGSATGKSTLARRLAKDLDIYLITKDNLKELFYDTLGTPADREESRVYGQAATDALYATARAFLREGKSVMVESAFNKQFADADILKMTDGIDVNIMQLHCTASPEVRLERYEARIRSGERHPAHPDGIGSRTVNDFAEDAEKYGPLAIEKTLFAHTDEFGEEDYRDLLKSFKMEGI